MKFIACIILLLLFQTPIFGQTNLIQNGSFSNTGTAWQVSGNFQYDSRFNLYRTAPGYSYFSSFNGLPENGISGSLSQDFFVPSNVSSLTVAFWYRISTSETSFILGNDTCRVTLIDPTGNYSPIFIKRLTNLNSNNSYSLVTVAINQIPSNRVWRLLFSAGNNSSLPTVFRIDDVSVAESNSGNSGCINWLNGVPPANQVVDSAMQVLCNFGIISANQNSVSLTSLITQVEVARCLGKALLGSAEPDFVDYFPNLFPSLSNFPLSDQRYIKLMLYLEYRSALSPEAGNDDISPFSRDYYYPLFGGSISKSDAIKAILETWDLKPSMLNYNPCGTSFSSIICDMKVSHKNLGWVERANVLGLLSNNISTPCGSGVSFGSDSAISYEKFYVLLARTLKYNRPTVGYDDLFIPNIFYTNNLNLPAGLERGVFNQFGDIAFDIPSGGVGIKFGITYHSNLTEIPFLNNNIDIENLWLKAKLQPLGGGWTHSYLSYIKIINNDNTPPERILIFWPDGTIHSYLFTQNKYETKGITDKLTIDSLTAQGQPKQITIQKGRTKFLYKNIDISGYQVLSLIKITDNHGHSNELEYSIGVAVPDDFKPRLLTKVYDSYSGRALLFRYYSGTNYLSEVEDNSGRILKFFPNTCTHDLDSTSDAKNQVTKYSYKVELGTTAYRTHLLQTVTRPNGNSVNSSYKNKKIQQITAGNYSIHVDAIPQYQSSWSQQTSKVSVAQNGQIISSDFVFNAQGNAVSQSNITENITRQYDSENRLIVEKDNVKKYSRKIDYDNNGFINKIVTTDSIYNDSTKYEFINNQYGEIITTYDYNFPTSYRRETNIHRDVATGDPINITEFEGTGIEVKHRFYYRADGLLTSYFSPTNFHTEFSYNQNGNLNRVMKFPKPFGSFISEYFNYDNLSRLTEHIDYEGINSTFEYDNNDNPILSVQNPLGLNLRTENIYDKNDNLISIKSPKGHITTLVYDYFTDALLEEKDGINRKRWAYNKDGTIDSFITKNNFIFKYQYFNNTEFPGTQLEGLLRTDGLRLYSYWDDLKELSRVNDLNGKTIWFRNSGTSRGKWGRPTWINTGGYFPNNPPDNIYYGYENNGRPSFIAYPVLNGKDYAFEYTYDERSKKLSHVRDRNNPTTTFVTYSYHADGSIDKEVYKNGDTIFHHYDAFNREDSVWAKNKNNFLLYSIGASYDKNGRRVRENTRVFYQGNEVTVIPNLLLGEIKTGLYDNRNRVTEFDGKTYNSDNSGNVINHAPPLTTYTYTQGYEQLQSFTKNGFTTEYEYDPLCFRRRKDDTYYIVDVLNTGNVIMEVQQNTSPINVFVYGRGLFCRIDPVTDSIFYYHYDSRGSVIAITDQEGQLVKYYQYDPFGALFSSGGTISWSNPSTYLGRHGVQSDDSDLYYMKARYYQPSTGRFISEDPVWATNLFTYSGNDPINYFDPGGAFAISVASFFDLRCIMSEYKYIIEQKRLDDDGVLTFCEARTLYRFGSGETQNVDINKFNLKGIDSERIQKNPLVRFDGWNDFNGINNAVVYGSLTFNESQGLLSSNGDTYNFELRPWKGNVARNIATIIGTIVHGEGKYFRINIYGVRQIK